VREFIDVACRLTDRLIALRVIAVSSASDLNASFCSTFEKVFLKAVLRYRGSEVEKLDARRIPRRDPGAGAENVSRGNAVATVFRCDRFDGFDGGDLFDQAI
jgi:hypothetical protein